MKKTFSVADPREFRGKRLSYFAAKIQVHYDSKNYLLILVPSNRKFIDYMRGNLNAVFFGEEPIKSFLMEIENGNICLKITHGQLGAALQILIDNNHIDYETAKKILDCHFKSNYELTYMQRFINFHSHYESIAAEAPTPSFKLVPIPE